MADPELVTARLTLRPLCSGDAEQLRAIAGSRRIADTTISVPHPFTADDAAAWIAASASDWRQGAACRFVIEDMHAGAMIGYIALYDIDHEHAQAELSFWLGDRHEGRGLMREAATAVVDFAFDSLALNRLCAFHMVRNAASARLLERLGFHREGLLRQRVRKWGVFEDVVVWGLVRDDPDDAGQGPA